MDNGYGFSVWLKMVFEVVFQAHFLIGCQTWSHVFMDQWSNQVWKTSQVHRTTCSPVPSEEPWTGIYDLKIFVKCYSPSGQSIVNEVNRNIHSRKGLTFQRRVILRINASNIKIIDSYSENVKKSYLIDFVSFAAQDSNQGCIFRNNFQNHPPSVLPQIKTSEGSLYLTQISKAIISSGKAGWLAKSPSY